MLKYDTISNLKLLHIFAYLDNLTYNLVTKIGILVMRNGSRSDTQITICVDQV